MEVEERNAAVLIMVSLPCFSVLPCLQSHLHFPLLKTREEEEGLRFTETKEVVSLIQALR